MPTDFFAQRPPVHPVIYVYRLIGVQSHEGYIKVGYTERPPEDRIREQIGATHVPYELLYTESAMRSDGSVFMDHDVHALLERQGYTKLDIPGDNEWYNCSVGDVKAAMIELKTGVRTDASRTQNFKMRPEQQRAVMRTEAYFRKEKKDDPTHAPKFLWNAKMRFGKTFAAYELSKRMGFRKILVLTFKPAVESAWREDLDSHLDFEGWQFISNKDARNQSINIDRQYAMADQKRPIVVFGSFQDLLGTNEKGGIKAKNEFIHSTNWDIVIFDEYHFGAWRENAARLFDNPDEEASADFDMEKYKQEEADNAYNETFLPITTEHYLFLSGTPFRALNNGEFIEDQIFSWTYSDEQRAKENWKGSGNPYLSLPRMVLLTYKIPDAIRQIAQQGEFNEFDLNVFFSARPTEKNKPESARFVYENEVQNWLNLIRGAYLPANLDDMKLGQDKRPPMPYSDTRLLNVLSHTLWFLPNVASCFAMRNLLAQKQNAFYHDYVINVCAGTKAGIGLDALAPVQRNMGDPLQTRTITLSCGKLTTGVTVKPWTGVFMLRNLKSPETYFQTAFRVQSPWTVRNGDGTETILKQECYVFDFALDRALRQVADYSCRLEVNESNPEKKVADFIGFLPVLAYDGSTMRQISAQDVLDIAMAGTSATLLARRWESALLVNVDNETLKRLLNNKEALDALMSIEGFRSLRQDIQTIINKSEAVKKAKKEGEDTLSSEEKKELSAEEKDFKSKRKEIQEKLIKFATRVPIFMYLTDYRESSLQDVITQLEPGLFKKVTGLQVKDFELLCSLGLFNSNMMNNAILNFKRYEDASLSYTGINKHEGKDVGGWDTVIRRAEYDRMFYNQQATMQAPPMPEEEPEEEAEEVPVRPGPEEKPAIPVAATPLVKEKPATTRGAGTGRSSGTTGTSGTGRSAGTTGNAGTGRSSGTTGNAGTGRSFGTTGTTATTGADRRSGVSGIPTPGRSILTGKPGSGAASAAYSPVQNFAKPSGGAAASGSAAASGGATVSKGVVASGSVTASGGAAASGSATASDGGMSRAAGASGRETPRSVASSSSSSSSLGGFARSGFSPLAHAAGRQESAPRFVMPVLREGMTVVHRKFGEGVITRMFANEKKIHVRFAEGEKIYDMDEHSLDNVFRKGYMQVKE